jgi:VanZ family protein
MVLLAVLPAGVGHFPAFAGADKLLHAAEFTILSVLVMYGLVKPAGLFLRVLLVVPIMALLAGSTELVQFLAPGRSPEVRDVIADMVGVGAGVAIVLVVERIRARTPVAG